MIEDSFEEAVEDTFDLYQEAAYKTAIYPNDVKVLYPSLGLAGEVGELCNKIKKHYRDQTPLNREDLAHELGDVLWYVAALATDLRVSLGYCALENVKKLKDRQERGVLGGSGDDR